jgi:hypothetical protein
MVSSAQPAIDGARLNAFIGRMLGDLGVRTSCATICSAKIVEPIQQIHPDGQITRILSIPI